MEAPARNLSQAEAPISQHLENIQKYNDSDLPTHPPHHRGGRGEGLTLGGGEGPRASDHIYIHMYIYIYIHIHAYIYIYIHM